MPVMILLIPNHMVIRSGLPDVLAVFLVAKSLKCGYKTGEFGILQGVTGVLPGEQDFPQSLAFRWV